jgi:hypothetical protein
MRQPALLPLVPVLALALAGCIATPEQLAPAALPPLAERVLGLVGEVPCEAEVGEGTSANLAPLRSSPLDRNGMVGAGELWLQGDWAYVARYGTGGFSIVSLADPLAPEEVAVWDPERTMRGLDVKALPDGSAVLVGNDDGVRIVDVRDPLLPREEHHEAFARTQAHMLTVFTVQGQDYLAVTKGDGEDMPIFRVQGGPGNHTLERVASPTLTLASTAFQALGQHNPQDITRTHDASFLDDPILGPTLWVANVWDGIVALDVADPAQPRVILRIPNLTPRYTHTVQTVVLGEGDQAQRVTISVSEIGHNVLHVWDTTDLTAPRMLAEWSVPRSWQPQHNPQLVPPYLYMAHYEHGVFVFALEDLLRGEARPIGKWASAGGQLGSSSPTGAVMGTLLNFSGTWDVGLRDGILYATDGGLHAVAFGCLTPGDAAMTSTG